MRVDVRVVLRCKRCEMTCNVDRALDAYFSLTEIIDVYRTKQCAHPAGMIEVKISSIVLSTARVTPTGKFVEEADEAECVQVIRQKNATR